MRRAAALGADYSHSAAGAATRFYPTRVTNSLNNWEPIVIGARPAGATAARRPAGAHELHRFPGGALAQRTLSGHI